jgi:FkbM family methyltransferase
MKKRLSVLGLAVGLWSILSLFGQGIKAPQASSPAETPATLLQEDKAAGLELWKTMLGKMWIPKPGMYVIKHLQWEQKVQNVYGHPQVHVQPGDVVIDCGAHIGGFTRTALDAGARMVIAIEPEIANIQAFHRNFAAELKSGSVRLIEEGVWDTDGKLSLHISDVGDSHSAVVAQAGGKEEVILVTTIDTLIKRLKLPRVDFIKMDIEGAEQKALAGAGQVLHKWKPRLAISSYHLKGDPAAITALAWAARPDYLVESKDLIVDGSGTRLPKVLFFR